jgi:hypothetical protein
MPGKLSRVETSYVSYGDRRLFEPLRSNDLVVVRNVMTDEIEDLSDV